MEFELSSQSHPEVSARITINPSSPEPAKNEPIPQPQVQQEEPFLWKSPPSPEFLDRPFEQRHKRGAHYIDARYWGAWRALIKLKRVPINDLMQEMILRTLEENEDLLNSRPDVVHYYEQKARDEFRL